MVLWQFTRQKLTILRIFDFFLIILDIKLTSIDVNLCRKWSKTIENTQNRQFLSSKWPQYYFSMVFKMVYIIFWSLLVCQVNIYWDNTHFDVNWHQFNVENDRKWSKIRKIVNFCCVNGHNTTFQWFLWWFISIPVVC